jgi:hypothetical protein
LVQLNIADPTLPLSLPGDAAASQSLLELLAVGIIDACGLDGCFIPNQKDTCD